MNLTDYTIHEKGVRIRKCISVVFFYFSLLLLIVSFIADGLAWYHAFRDGMVMDNRGDWDGNHGPWRHYYTGRRLIWDAIYLQHLSLISAIVSLLIERTRRVIWLVIITFMTIIIFTATHYWLVD
jgi:hypothetical protein